MLSYFSFIDNDKPTVTSSNDFPIESTDDVVLTCEAATSDSGIVFEWYDANGRINGASSNTYSLPDN